MSSDLQIILDNKITASFVKANLYIINNFYNVINEAEDKELIVIKYWKSLFDAELIKNKSGYFTTIKFSNEKKRTMFLLRFT